ncbi:MAG: exo-alpha-sialidase, partial [Dehalococcoidales bacterium]|nr:exo-alpha-sialidase [Dehalococcoidales bacterium]
MKIFRFLKISISLIVIMVMVVSLIPAAGVVGKVDSIEDTAVPGPGLKESVSISLPEDAQQRYEASEPEINEGITVVIEDESGRYVVSEPAIPAQHVSTPEYYQEDYMGFSEPAISATLEYSDNLSECGIDSWQQLSVELSTIRPTGWTVTEPAFETDSPLFGYMEFDDSLPMTPIPVAVEEITNENRYILYFDANRNNDFTDDISYSRGSGSFAEDITFQMEYNSGSCPYQIDVCFYLSTTYLNYRRSCFWRGMVSYNGVNRLTGVFDDNLNGIYGDGSDKFAVDIDGDGQIDGSSIGSEMIPHTSFIFNIAGTVYTVEAIENNGTSLSVVPAGSGSLSGYITSVTTGNPINGAVVRLYVYGGQYETISDTNGYYQLSAPVGSYRKMLVKHDTFVPAFSAYNYYLINTGSGSLRDVSLKDFGPLNGIVTLSASYGGYHFLAGETTQYSGDFSIFMIGPIARIDPNYGNRGLLDLGDIGTTPLNDVQIPQTGYLKGFLFLTQGHTYVSLAREGEEGHYIVFRVTEAVAGSHVTLEYLYTPPPAGYESVPPALISPANNSVHRPGIFTLDWEDVTDAIGYQVQIDTVDTFDSPDFGYANPANSAYGYNLGVGTYYWRVKAFYEEGESNFSEVWSFRIADQVIQVTDDVNTDCSSSICTASDGTLWIAWESDRSGNYDIWYKTSSDNGKTWSSEFQLTTDTSNDLGPDIYQTTDGDVWVFWYSYRSGNFDIWYTITNDGGISWADPVQFTFNTDEDMQPSVTQTSDGRLLVTWSSLRSENWDIWYRESTNDGLSWSYPIRITTDSELDMEPSIIQMNDGQIWIVWASYRSGHFEIWQKSSNDNGQTWSSANQITNGNNFYREPSVTQTDDGKIWIAWWNLWNSTWNIYYKSSVDESATWGEVIQFSYYTGWEGFPDITALADGKIAIVWSSDRDTYRNIWFGIPGVYEDIQPPPSLESLKHSPYPNPDSDEVVTITAETGGENEDIECNAVLWIDGVVQPEIRMYDDGTHNDETPCDKIWTLSVGPFPAGTVVEYKIRVKDINGNDILVPQYPGSFTVMEPLDPTCNTLLIIDSEHTINVECYGPEYFSILESSGIDYDFWDCSLRGIPEIGELMQYESGAVLWCVIDVINCYLLSTDSYTEYNRTSIQVLTNYLESGGNLLVCGDMISYYFTHSYYNNEFQKNYLHSNYQGFTGLYQMNGVDQDPITDGMIIAMSESGNEIDPIAPAVSILTWDTSATSPVINTLNQEQGLSSEETVRFAEEITLPEGMTDDMPEPSLFDIQSSGTAGIRVNTGTYKVVYFTFGFIDIVNFINQTALMSNALDWLLEEPVEPGDANGDGTVNVLDITKVARIILEIDPETPGADADKNGAVNVLDMTRIAKLILGVDPDRYGGTLTILAGSDITTWNPGAVTCQSAGQGSYVLEQLLGIDRTKGPAGTGETSYIGGVADYRYLGGNLVESWETPEVGVWVLNIRQGVHFAYHPEQAASQLVGGREMTADDVIASIEYMRDNPVSSLQCSEPSLISNTTCERTGEWQVTVRTPVAPTTAYLWIMGGGGVQYVWPREFLETYATSNNWWDVVGTGPYILDDYVQGSVGRYIRNPNYWDINPCGPGQGEQLPYIEKLNYQIVPDYSTRLAAVRTGKADWSSVDVLEIDDFDMIVRSNPDIKAAQTIIAPQQVAGRVDLDGPFSKLKVRQAMMLAIDHPTIVSDLYDGRAELIDSPARKWYTTIHTPLEEL